MFSASFDCFLCLVICRWLYWTDWGTQSKIERASMDGQSRSVLHDTGLVWPNGLTIDYQTQRLFWVDANLNIIESSNVDGSDRTVVTTQLIIHPFDITFHQDRLYWSDWAFKAVLTTHTGEPDNVTLLVTSLPVEPMGISVIASSRQPKGTCILLPTVELTQLEWCALSSKPPIPELIFILCASYSTRISPENTHKLMGFCMEVLTLYTL